MASSIPVRTKGHRDTACASVTSKCDVQGSPWGDEAQREPGTPPAGEGGMWMDVWMAANPTSWPPAKAPGHEGGTAVDTTGSRHQTSLTQHPRVQVARRLAGPLCAGFLLGERKRNCEMDHREDCENH